MSKKKKLDSLAVSAFCESMGMMARAGIQTDEAISLLGQEDNEGILSHALHHMSETVESGYALSEAMEKTEVFPEYAIRMIKAGETSGRLESVLFRLSEYYQNQKTITEKIKSAITYPASMMVMIIAVLAIMLIMVLPSFTDVYDNLTGNVVSSSYRYITWAYVFCWVALVIMVIMVLGLVLGLRMWDGEGRERVERFLEKIPASRKILEDMGMFRFTSALELFLASGEMQDIAVIQSIDMIQYKPLEEKIRKCVTIMEEGHGFSKAAYDVQLFEPVYGRMLLAGERSGNMEDILNRLTSLIGQDSSHQVDRIIDIVDPLLSGILMVTVGLSLLSVMLPLIGMMNSIG